MRLSDALCADGDGFSLRGARVALVVAASALGMASGSAGLRMARRTHGSAFRLVLTNPPMIATVSLPPADTPCVVRRASRCTPLALASVASFVHPRCLDEVAVARIGGRYGP